jgi:hypothetical protein
MIHKKPFDFFGTGAASLFGAVVSSAMAETN